jgi:hypothetical protein
MARVAGNSSVMTTAQGTASWPIIVRIGVLFREALPGTGAGHPAI